MRKSRWIIAAGVIAALIAGGIVLQLQSSTTVVMVVRHAEKNNSASCSATDPSNVPISSPLGTDRAAELAHVVENAGVQAIFASELCRTQQTVQPTATQLGLTRIDVNQHPGGVANVDELLRQVSRDHKGQVILIAGHNDTVPLIIAGLGAGPINPIQESEFDNLYVVTIRRSWLKFGSYVTMVRLKYGRAT